MIVRVFSTCLLLAATGAANAQSQTAEELIQKALGSQMSNAGVLLEDIKVVPNTNVGSVMLGGEKHLFSLPGLSQMVNAPGQPQSQRWAEYLGSTQATTYAPPHWHVNALEQVIKGQGEGIEIEFGEEPLSPEVWSYYSTEIGGVVGEHVQVFPTPVVARSDGLEYRSFDVVGTSGQKMVVVLETDEFGRSSVRYEIDTGGVVNNLPPFGHSTGAVGGNGDFTGLTTVTEPGECLITNDSNLLKSCMRQAVALTQKLEGIYDPSGSAVWLTGRYFLTARHVFQGSHPRNFWITISHDVKAPSVRHYEVENGIPFSIDGQDIDLALVWTKEQPKWVDQEGDEVTNPPELVFLTGDQREQMAPARFRGAGFGFGIAVSSDGKSPGTRRSGQMQIAPCAEVPDEDCRNPENFELLATPVQSLGPEPTVSLPCAVDSGSPLMVELVDDEGRTKLALVGIYKGGAMGCVSGEAQFVDLTDKSVQTRIAETITSELDSGYVNLTSPESRISDPKWEQPELIAVNEIN